MSTAGYSGTPLEKKLGIKEGYTIGLHKQPKHYFDLFVNLPKISVVDHPKEKSLDFIHGFFTDKTDFEIESLNLKKALKFNGTFWISWPKGSSKIPANLNRDSIRAYLLSNGLVDVKVCAVDENWSGLKFMYRIKDRK